MAWAAMAHLVAGRFRCPVRAGGGGWGTDPYAYSSGGGGPGSGTTAARKTDPLYETGVGDAGKSGQVVLQWRLPTGSLRAMSGDGQSTGQGEPFRDALVVKARSSAGKTLITDASVTFTTAGTQTGPVTVTSRSGSAQVVLTLQMAPAFPVSPGGPLDVQLLGGGESDTRA
ncbi:hypothetical protein ACH4M7_29310 [Streptomyces sp. NPDC017249]|uniref:hypothetical protein n=2 Tax=Streptomyces TaxID=1883 RepID=UPI0037A8DFDB